jgi:Tfp pilus assembly protein PilV
MRQATGYRESGHSLVEVMASIVILAVAIIPMVNMFDAGLRAATAGGNYDRARTLAEKQLEGARSLPYASVEAAFPNAPCDFDASGLCAVSGLRDPAPMFTSFTYELRKQYVRLGDDGVTLVESSTDAGMIRISVTVGWGDGFREKTYTAVGLKGR